MEAIEPAGPINSQTSFTYLEQVFGCIYFASFQRRGAVPAVRSDGAVRVVSVRSGKVVRVDHLLDGRRCACHPGSVSVSRFSERTALATSPQGRKEQVLHERLPDLAGDCLCYSTSHHVHQIVVVPRGAELSHWRQDVQVLRIVSVNFCYRRVQQRRVLRDVSQQSNNALYSSDLVAGDVRAAGPDVVVPRKTRPVAHRVAYTAVLRGEEVL